MTLSRKLAMTIAYRHAPLDLVIESLSKYKLLSLLVPIKQHLEIIAKEQEVNDTVIIESPFSVSEESIKKIISMTGSGSSKYEFIINRDLMAGFKARYKGKLYDGSAERIIKQLMH